MKQQNSYNTPSIDGENFVLTALENQLRRMSHYQAMPLPVWFAD